MVSRPRTFDECLAGASPEQRATLEKMRRSIRRLAPRAEECVSYGAAAFRLDGKPLAALAAAAGHCSYYPMSGRIVAALAGELAGYDTGKGTIRFPSNRPLPATLLRKLVRARTDEIAAATPSAGTSPRRSRKK